MTNVRESVKSVYNQTKIKWYSGFTGAKYI